MSAPQLRDFAPQGEVYEALVQSLAEDRFSHATLITGARGMGKRSLADCIAQYLLCTGTQKPCGVCPGCRQVLSGNHPDLLKPAPPARKKTIPVEDIKSLNAFVSRAAYEGGRRVIILRAEELNDNGQNALLKNLEEPLPGNYYLLTAESPSALLTTVVSRCRRVALHAWPDSYIDGLLRAAGADPGRRKETLALCGGSIGRALEMAADEEYWQRRREVIGDFFGMAERSSLLVLSDKWSKRAKPPEQPEEAEEEATSKAKKKKPQGDTAEELLNDLEDMVHTLLRIRLKQAPAEAAEAFPGPWRRMAAAGTPADFLALEDEIRQARRLHASNVTWQAVLEKLLLRMMEEKQRWSVS